MNIIGYSDQKEPNTKNYKKMKIIIVVSLVLLVIALVAVYGLIMYYESQKLKLVVNDKTAIIESSLIHTDEETKNMYLSIEEMAKLSELKFFRGEYGQNNEVKNKCYLTNTDEVISFEQGSNKIYKRSLKNDSDIAYYEMPENVRIINGKLYVPMSSAGVSFNIMFQYNKANNQFSIKTLPYLYEYYTNLAIEKFGYDKVSIEYDNKKAILYNMLVVEKDTKIGVINLNNETIIGNKYDALLFIEETQEFYATNSKK